MAANQPTPALIADGPINGVRSAGPLNGIPSEFSRVSDWFSEPLIFDATTREVSYFFRGKHGAGLPSEPTIEGCCRMVFDNRNRGHGYFYDLVKNVTRQDFTIFRLERAMDDAEFGHYVTGLEARKHPFG
jgi:hypothetical protein